MKIFLAHLHIPGGDQHVVLCQCPLYIHQRQSVRFELARIHVGINAAKLATKDRRRNYTLNRLQLVSQLIVGNVIELLLIHPRTRHHHQTQRQRGGRIDRHQHRRNGPGRQIEHVAHRIARRLSHGRVERDPFLKKVLHDTDTSHGLRLLVLDPYTLASPPLHAAHDVLFHDLRGHPGVKGHDLDRWRLKDRKQIGRNLGVGVDAQHRNGQSGHNHKIRVAENRLSHDGGGSVGFTKNPAMQIERNSRRKSQQRRNSCAIGSTVLTHRPVKVGAMSKICVDLLFWHIRQKARSGGIARRWPDRRPLPHRSKAPSASLFRHPLHFEQPTLHPHSLRGRKPTYPTPGR